MKNQKPISELVLERLASYHRLLIRVYLNKIDLIDSERISKDLSIDASLIRRDLSCLGKIGQRGKGYHVALLLENIEKFLGINKKKYIIIIGFGNIGQAITQYLWNSSIYKVIGIYDQDPQKIGMTIHGIMIQDIKNIKKLSFQEPIDFAILTVPASSAQMITNMLIKNNIKGILNFAPTHLILPDHIFYREVDVIKELNVLSGNSNLLSNR